MNKEVKEAIDELQKKKEWFKEGNYVNSGTSHVQFGQALEEIISVMRRLNHEDCDICDSHKNLKVMTRKEILVGLKALGIQPWRGAETCKLRQRLEEALVRHG